MFDPDAEFRPEILGEVEIRAKVEHSSMTDFRADSFRFDQPVGEVRAPVAGRSRFGLANEHDPGRLTGLWDERNNQLKSMALH